MRPDVPSAAPVTEDDLLAYVDDQLPLVRRVEVEVILAAHPDIAARVMSDLAQRDALRAALAEPVEASPRIRVAVAELENAFLMRRAMRYAGRGMAAALLIGLGWVAHTVTWMNGDSVAAHHPPAFVADAVDAYRTATLRSGLASQPSAATLDRGELAASTGIDLPALPATWTVRDVQVFPARDGHSIEVALATPHHGLLHLFAGNARRFDVIAPAATETDAGRTIYWQIGQTVYALSGDLPERELARDATLLASSFN